MSEDEETMLVRMPGGDVIRRPVAYKTQALDQTGKPLGDPVCEPELHEDEAFVQVMGNPIPLIIKTR